MPVNQTRYVCPDQRDPVRWRQTLSQYQGPGPPAPWGEQVEQTVHYFEINFVKQDFYTFTELIQHFFFNDGMQENFNSFTSQAEFLLHLTVTSNKKPSTLNQN